MDHVFTLDNTDLSGELLTGEAALQVCMRPLWAYRRSASGAATRTDVRACGLPSVSAAAGRRSGTWA